MKYPNRLQWAVIWGTALVALWMWIESSGPGGRRLKIGEDEPRKVVAFVVVGALAAWMLSDVKLLRDVTGWDNPEIRPFGITIGLVIGLVVVFMLLG